MTSPRSGVRMLGSAKTIRSNFNSVTTAELGHVAKICRRKQQIRVCQQCRDPRLLTGDSVSPSPTAHLETYMSLNRLHEYELRERSTVRAALAQLQEAHDFA